MNIVPFKFITNLEIIITIKIQINIKEFKND